MTEDTSPNVRIGYVDARTGEDLGFCDYYDPGLVNSRGGFTWPAYTQGKPLRAAPRRPS